MFHPDDSGVYARAAASPGRRWLGVGMQYLLGLLILYVLFVQPPAAGWAVLMAIVGFGALFLAEAMRRATTRTLELHRDALRDDAGRLIARMDQVVAVERGVFAFKPSNGFLLVMTEKGGRSWAPGLWWRAGRRVGIGGVLPQAETKFMAEVIATWIAQRDQSRS